MLTSTDVSRPWLFPKCLLPVTSFQQETEYGIAGKVTKTCGDAGCQNIPTDAWAPCPRCFVTCWVQRDQTNRSLVSRLATAMTRQNLVQAIRKHNGVNANCPHASAFANHISSFSASYSISNMQGYFSLRSCEMVSLAAVGKSNTSKHRATWRSNEVVCFSIA